MPALFGLARPDSGRTSAGSGGYRPGPCRRRPEGDRVAGMLSEFRDGIVRLCRPIVDREFRSDANRATILSGARVRLLVLAQARRSRRYFGRLQSSVSDCSISDRLMAVWRVRAPDVFIGSLCPDTSGETPSPGLRTRLLCELVSGMCEPSRLSLGRKNGKSHSRGRDWPCSPPYLRGAGALTGGSETR